MNDINKARLVVQAMDSLNQTVRIAGRTPFTYKELESMSLLDFICSVAGPNEIGFFLNVKYEDEEEEDIAKKPTGVM